MSLSCCRFTKILYLFNVPFWISLLCILRYVDINVMFMFIQHFASMYANMFAAIFSFS